MFEFVRGRESCWLFSFLVKEMEEEEEQGRGRKSYRAAVGEFFGNTSLHGMAYVGMMEQKKKPWYYDWFYFVAITTGVVCAFTLSLIQIEDYRSSTVQTTFEGTQTSNENVFFPTVTLCNINRIRRSFLREHELLNDLPLIKKFYYGTKSPGEGTEVTEDGVIEAGDVEKMTLEEVARMREIATRKEIVDQGKVIQGYFNMGTGSNTRDKFYSNFKNDSMSLFLLAALQAPSMTSRLLAAVFRKC